MVFNLLHMWIIGGNKTKQNQETLFLYHLSWIGHRTPDYLQWVKLTYSDADNSRIQQPSTIQTTSSAFVPVSQLPRFSPGGASCAQLPHSNEKLFILCSLPLWLYLRADKSMITNVSVINFSLVEIVSFHTTAVALHLVFTIGCSRYR